MNDDQSPLALSTIRRNRGISLQEIAESTKIGIRSLEAIERGEFRKLPGGIYNTNYIRQYARAIDYDETALLAAYYRVTAGAAPGPDGPGDREGKSLFGGYRPASNAV
ncbi:MAG: helix-turn-helix domain-containing protein [Bryobacteraceae bacterium]|jgi:cytoskeletal protein RodZ